MNITISPNDGVPIYLQIAKQIRYMIASGQLVAGDEISPVRKLAMQLKVTPNTVVKAYAELEAAGLIRKRRGAGTYVSDAHSPLADVERARILEDRVNALLAEAHQLGFSISEIHALLTRLHADMHNQEQMEQASG